MTLTKLAPLAFALTLIGAQVIPIGQARLPTGCSNGQIAEYNSTTRVWECAADSAGTGDVVGPASAVGNMPALFDSTTGKLLKSGLADPNADRLMFWDDSAGSMAMLTAGSGLTITDTTITASGGSATSTSAFASPPGSPASGDLWLPSDSFYISRYSGSVFAPWGPIFPMTPPVSGDFSWVNQGTATITTTYGGVHLYKPGGVGSHSLALRVKAAPATPYTITTAFIPRMEASQFLYAGIAFRQSGDGKIATFALYMDTGVNTGAYLIAKKFTNETTDSGANYILRPALNPNSLVWLQMSDDGVNRILRWSTDGQNWEVLHTVGRTDYLTADQVGFFVNANSVTYGAGMTLLSWKEGS